MTTAGISPMVARLLGSDDLALVYRTRVEVLGEDPARADLVELRSSIAGSQRARKLLGPYLDGRAPDRHAYRKHQGPHWTLVQLATVAYPPGDPVLPPLRDRAYDWMLDPSFLEPPRSVVYEDQPERPRRCGSQEGNAIWYSMRLGLVDDRTAQLVDRLTDFQWPDGGWNCDKRPEARTSSFMETLIPLRALGAWAGETGDAGARSAADAAIEFLLERRLLWRKSDGRAADPRFFLIHHPISFYDVLFALQVMAEVGRIGDPRCADALDVLGTKQTSDGGFPAEVTTARASDSVATRASYTEWGPGGSTRSNPLVSIAALAVMRAAGRLPLD